MRYSFVVAPILISQCYNPCGASAFGVVVVAPILISQCYNTPHAEPLLMGVVAPILISQCYNFRFQIFGMLKSCSSHSHFAVLQ